MNLFIPVETNQRWFFTLHTFAYLENNAYYNIARLKVVNIKNECITTVYYTVYHKIKKCYK